MSKICDACIRNKGIREFIAEKEMSGTCSFCRTRQRRGHVARMKDVRSFVWERIEQDYEDAVNVLPWEGAEGGYQGSASYEADEILTEQVELDIAPAHLDAIVDALAESRRGITWCVRDPFGLSAFEQFHHSWDAFAAAVKWETRYFFNREGAVGDEDEGGELWLPNRLLAETAKLAGREGLIATIPSGLRLHRARHRETDAALAGPLDLGPPPPEAAVRANRMNPPGIPIFYGAQDVETAVVETVEPGQAFVVGLFEVRRPLRLLDLASMGPMPDYFETDSETHQGLAFLDRFADAVASPVVRDDRNHVEYVPTQVVGEYFRKVHKWEGHRVDGICWRSAANRRKSHAIFATRADLVLSREEVARLTEAERRWREDGSGWLALVESREGTRQPE